jgi:hypothetical protein
LGQDKIQTVFSYEKEELNIPDRDTNPQSAEKRRFLSQPSRTRAPSLSDPKGQPIFLTLTQTETELIFPCDPEDVGYVKTLVYETLVELDATVNRLKQTYKAEEIQKNLAQSEGSGLNPSLLANTSALIGFPFTSKVRPKGR